MVSLFNKISNYSIALNVHKLSWGSCILSVIAIKNLVSSLGVKGKCSIQKAKQCITAAMMILDGHDVKNMDILDQILPHKCDKARDDWIDKCIEGRLNYELFDGPKFFCGKEQK